MSTLSQTILSILPREVNFQSKTMFYSVTNIREAKRSLTHKIVVCVSGRYIFPATSNGQAGVKVSV